MGCGNPDAAYELLIRIDPSLGTVTLLSPSPLHRGHPVLPKLAYFTLCRSIQRLALLTRGDAAKDLELLVLRHQLTGHTPPFASGRRGPSGSLTRKRL